MTRESTRHMKLICNDVILRLSHATIANFWSVNNRRLTYKITLMVVLNFSTLPFNKNFCSSFCTDLDFFSFFFFLFFFWGGGGGLGGVGGLGGWYYKPPNGVQGRRPWTIKLYSSLTNSKQSLWARNNFPNLSFPSFPNRSFMD